MSIPRLSAVQKIPPERRHPNENFWDLTLIVGLLNDMFIYSLVPVMFDETAKGETAEGGRHAAGETPQTRKLLFA